jgi:hypothetical protein
MSALNSPGAIPAKPAGGGNAAGALFSPGVRPGANAAGGGNAAGGAGDAAGGAAAVNAPAPPRIPHRAAIPGGIEGLLSPGPRIPAGGKKGPTSNIPKVMEILDKYDRGNSITSEEDRNTLLEYYRAKYNPKFYKESAYFKKIYSILYPGANITQGKPYAFGPNSERPYKHSSSNYGGGSRSRRNRKTRNRKNSKTNRSRRNRKTNRSRRH